MAKRIHIHLHDAVYDPSNKTIPLAQRSPRQQAAITAYGSKPAEQKVIVHLKSSAGNRWKETMKLSRGQTPEEVAKGCAEMYQRNAPSGISITVERFEVK